MKCSRCTPDYCACTDFFEAWRAYFRGDLDHLMTPEQRVRRDSARHRASREACRMRADDIVALLRRTRLRVSTERHLHESIADALTGANILFEREVRLSATDRIDFVAGRIGIEAKVRCDKRAIYRQLARYAQHDEVSALILVSGTAMGLPPEIDGTPIYSVSIGRSFL